MSRKVFGRSAAIAFLSYIVAAEALASGLVIGLTFHGRRHNWPHVTQSSIPELNCVALWDGQAYLSILLNGYSYSPTQGSMVAYFPLFPLTGAAVMKLSTLPPNAAAWLTAQAALLGSFVLFAKYQIVRRESTDADDHVARLHGSTTCGNAALALYPPCFFMWMTYSESLFLLLTLAAMFGIQRRWRPVWIALVIGAATATRPVGVALVAPLALYIWSWDTVPSVKRGRDLLGHTTKAMIKASLVLPLACWGLLAYMTFQWNEFGTPLAFAQTQEHWSMRVPIKWPAKLLVLASGEPIWSAYVSGSAGHWTRLEEGVHPLLSLHFFEPIYFVGAVVLVYIGTLKKWLTDYEIVLAAGLLFIPYVTKGYEMTMASQARFTSVVFPIYIVLGNILARVPWWVAGGYFVISATYLGIYSAMWAAGHVLI